MEDELNKPMDGFTNEEEAERSSVFSQLKVYCLELLELLQTSNRHSSAVTSLLRFLQNVPAHALQPFFDYTLFPLLLLLDAAVNCRSSNKELQEKSHKVSDKVAEGVVQCLEQLLRKCYLGSVDQMVVLLKKLTSAAMLSPSEASEEFREGVIMCFRALILGLSPCSDSSCSCKLVSGLPSLLESGNLQTSLTKASESGECLIAFLQSENASAAIGHWLSLLLKAADTEAARGHRGSGKLRVETFLTARVLVARVGTADALAFFLPGVVSQFAKVLHVSKMMISGAAGNVEAIDQAIRGLAEYLMIVLQDDVNSSVLDISKIVVSGSEHDTHKSSQSFLEELRQLPVKAQDRSKSADEEIGGELVNVITHADPRKGKGSLHVDRTKDWLQKTSAHVNKILTVTIPHICVHPAIKVRKGFLAAIRGLLSRCSYTLKESRLMLLECLCVLVVDDCEEISAAAQEFLEDSRLLNRNSHLQNDVSDIFNRLIAKLPKVVFENEESLALSHAQQLLVIIYYSGPQFLLDQLQSPVTAARFLDVFAHCLSQNSTYTGSLDKLLLGRPSSKGFLPSIAELKAGADFNSNGETFMGSVPSGISKLKDIQEKVKQHPQETVQKIFELPRMPPWFVSARNQKLYQSLAGSLRLVGLSLMPDYKSHGHLSIITDIPLGYIQKLIADVRAREYSKESWQLWYNRTGAGQLLHQASTAACIINEMIFGLSNEAIDLFGKIFHKSRVLRSEVQRSNAELTDVTPCNFVESVWKTKQREGVKSHLIDCIGRIIHEYLAPEIWELPLDHKSVEQAEDMTLHFFHDTAMLHQVIIDGIGIFAFCLRKDFASSGFLHSSLYLLLENLICSNFQIRSAADAVLHVLSATFGYQTVGHLVLANADYVIDSICRQLRHLDLNPHVPNVLAAMLSYIGVAHKILPLLEEPVRSVSQELEILGRHQHPDLTISFLKAVAEIVKASKNEAYSLPSQAELNLMQVKSKISDMEDKEKAEFRPGSGSYSSSDGDVSHSESEQWESVLFNLNDSRRYRRTVGSIAASCLTTATPLLASVKQAVCLVALDIVEYGIATLAKVEEAYKYEKATKETMEEVFLSNSSYHLKDTLDAAQDDTDENRLLPAMNKLWPFLVICVRSKDPIAVRRCLIVVTNVVQICGGDFFTRRFQTDGPHFWKLLSTSPFQKMPKERTPLLLPYRSTSNSSDESMAEGTSLKVQVAVLNMIADLSWNKKSACGLEVVLKKVSGLVVAIACSGILGLRDASINALTGLAFIDPDLIWLLLADVYYSLKKRDLPSPPTSDLPELSDVLPMSPKEYLYVQYGGRSYGFDVDFSAVDTVFRKLHSDVFTNQIYI